MTAQTRSDILIALSVICCSIVLLAALTVALSGYRFQTPASTLHIDFESVVGIRVNSDIRYAGKPVGAVTSMRFLTHEERLKKPGYIVRLTACLDEGTPELFEGTQATIVSDTILAEKFVDLLPVPVTPGKEMPPMLADNSIINGQETIGFDELTRAGFQVVEKVDDILIDLRKDYPDLHHKIGSLIENGSNLMRNSDKLVSKIDQLVESNDPSIKKLIQDLNVTSQNLKVTTTYAKALTATLGARPWSLIWGGEENRLPTESEILASQKPIQLPLPEDPEEKAERSARKPIPSWSTKRNRSLSRSMNNDDNPTDHAAQYSQR